MKTARKVAGVAVLGVVLAVASPIPVFGAAPASITQAGWWTRRPGASALPKGGFELGLAPDGPYSQAALRITVDAVQLDSALLELTESEAYGSEIASIHACPTNDKWAAANPGAWGDAPSPNCAAKVVPLTRRSTGEWSGDVKSLLNVGTVSIVLVPSSNPDTQGAPFPYYMVFARARLLASAPGPSPAPGGSGSDEPATPTSPEPQVIDAPAAPPSGFAPGAPPVVAAPMPASTGAAPPPFAGTSSSEGDRGRPWWRLLFLLPLAAALGTLAVFARRRVLGFVS